MNINTLQTLLEMVRIEYDEEANEGFNGRYDYQYVAWRNTKTERLAEMQEIIDELMDEIAHA